MASEALKNMQDKLFRGGPPVSQQSPDPDARDPRLTINIPKPPPMVTPPKLSKPNIPSPKAADASAGTADESGTKSYRERLAQTLGDEYNGAERYRLLQDEKKEKHWKRWGPYLSDRQWVRVLHPLSLIFLT